jgi:Zn-dependent protease
MTQSFRLGRIAGVDVGLNWTVILVFGLVTTGLAAGRFPEIYPDLAPATYAVVGFAAGLLFFASLLAHEVSHAVVARRNGIDVEGITLWLLGGVAQLRSEPQDAKADLHIAAVGPLTSVVLAVGFLAIRWALWWAGLRGIALGLFEWLALVNAVLAAFNLVPAAPLDGGRILRSLLWRWRGDRTTAAVAAARAGRSFGWLLVVVGAVDLFAGGALGGPWLILVGWFIASAAAAEEQDAVVSSALSEVRVAAVMTADPQVAPADISVETFLDDYVFPRHHSTFPLVDTGGSLVGLATLRRVKQVPPGARSSTPLRAVAAGIGDLPLVAPDDLVTDVLPRMTRAADGRALVVAGGRLVGIVSPTDIVRRLELAGLRPPADRQSGVTR